jgi:predicted phosphodiesterase
MARIVHLSDVHLQAPKARPGILAAVVEAVGREAEHQRVDLVAVTGDLFNSADLDPRVALPRAMALVDDLRRKTGGARVVILPGNHDVRQSGVRGPHRPKLFGALREALADDTGVIVHGAEPLERPARLGRLLAPDEHGLPAEVVLLDSSHLPSGLLSAGGLLRQEDLLGIAAELLDRPPGQPVIVLLHHHLIPTPLTDLERIAMPESWGPLGGVAQFVLRAALAGGDREELTMTALGAGTALSTLHTLERAVLILHGHKHYPTVRLLRGIFAEHGDIILSSAGSAGLREPWSAGDERTAPLWPSFNLLDIDGEEVRITTVLVKPDASKTSSARPMLHARRRGTSWDLVERHPDRTPQGAGPGLDLNRAEFDLENTSASLWSARVERTLTPTSAENAPKPYEEPVAGSPRAILQDVDEAPRTPEPPRHRPRGEKRPTLHVRTDGVSRYRLADGWAGTFQQAKVDQGRETSPYEWVGLLNRHACKQAELVLRGLPRDVGVPFGSATDLGSGMERPVRLSPMKDGYMLTMTPCPPRTLLRIYWGLPR